MIPRIVHNIWIQGYTSMPSSLQEQYKKHVDMNPSWVFMFWDGSMIEDLLKTKYINIYNVYINVGSLQGYGGVAIRSDIARYVILYEFGGVYYDMDFICTEKLDNIIHSNSNQIIIASSHIPLLDNIPFYTNFKPRYCACFMASPKGHVVWHKVFEKVLRAQNKQDIGSALDITLQEEEVHKHHKLLKDVASHYDCQCKGKVCFTPIKSSWNTIRPFIKYINCYFKYILITIFFFIFFLILLLFWTHKHHHHR